MDYCKVFKIGESEIVFRKSIIINGQKQKPIIKVHVYIETVSLGYLQESETNIPYCCFGCLDKDFDMLSQEYAEKFFNTVRSAGDKYKKEYFQKNQNHN